MTEEEIKESTNHIKDFIKFIRFVYEDFDPNQLELDLRFEDGTYA